jgi:hypothetical protein
MKKFMLLLLFVCLLFLACENANVGNAIQALSWGSINTGILTASEDKVGIWGVFGPGTGNINKNYIDWVFYADFNMKMKKTIKDITFTHSSVGEQWSTSNTRAYPIVVYENSRQLNFKYGQTFELPVGRKTFK